MYDAWGSEDGPNIPKIPLSSTRDGDIANFYVYPGNAFKGIMKGVQDWQVSEGLDCLDDLSDEMIEKMVADTNFSDYPTNDDMSQPSKSMNQRVIDGMKTRRDILKEVNAWYKKNISKGHHVNFFDIDPDDYQRKINSSAQGYEMSGLLLEIDPAVMWKIMDLSRKGCKDSEIHGKLMPSILEIPSFSQDHSDWLKLHVSDIKPESVARFLAFMR